MNYDPNMVCSGNKAKLLRKSMSNQEPAFPQKEPLTSDAPGMTLRDYFAAKAMQAALTGATLPGLMERAPETMAVIDKLAAAMYAIADAMMAARERA